MPFGGGTWVTQNKVIPGAYINVVSAGIASAALSDRGIATMPLELDWGPEDKIFKVTTGDMQKYSKKIFGYGYTDKKMKGLRDLFAGGTLVLYAYRLNGGGVKAANDYATAKYTGIRGNDIKISIAKDIDDPDSWNVTEPQLLYEHINYTLTDNNQTFSPEYCHTEKSVTEQLEAGVRFFSRKYPEMKYLAYFQAYTNTYDELDSLTSKYEEALACPGVVGLIVGTRPDCMPDALLDYFSALSQKKFVMIEYGLESTLDRTLTRINRGHTHAESEEAIRRTAARNIYTGAHLILGLPGESREDILHHADILSALPLTTLKLHQLQLIRGTRMAREQAEHPEQFHLYTADEYIDLVIDFIERLNPSIVVERFVSQSPKELLIAPDWGLKNFEFTAKVNKRISERNARQGRLLNPPSSEPVLPGM